LRGQEVPLAGDAFQFMDTAFLEADSRAGDEIFDSARNQHFACSGE